MGEFRLSQVYKSPSTAPEGRQKVAHGVSRGEGESPMPSPSGAIEYEGDVFRPYGARLIGCRFHTAHAVGYSLPPLRGGLVLTRTGSTRLAPWAAFCHLSGTGLFSSENERRAAHSRCPPPLSRITR